MSISFIFCGESNWFEESYSPLTARIRIPQQAASCEVADPLFRVCGFSVFVGLRLLGRPGTADLEERVCATLTSVLLGVLAGQVLMSDRSPQSKLYRLLSVGALSLVAGLVWSLAFPVIKLMWTSSYVLISGGLSFMILALFYWIIDVLR